MNSDDEQDAGPQPDGPAITHMQTCLHTGVLLPTQESAVFCGVSNNTNNKRLLLLPALILAAFGTTRHTCYLGYFEF
jgi:hypothetical protein